MKRKINYILLGLLALATACSKDDAFYTAEYPIVAEEVVVTATAITPPEGEDGEEANAAQEALIAQIRSEVLAAAPVKVGGGYVLDFLKHNGGALQVQTSAEGEVIQGVFVKTPGTGMIQFIYGEHDYSCTIATYTDTDGIRKAALVEDLTEQYKTLYPTANITQVERRAYTSSRSTQ